MRELDLKSDRGRDEAIELSRDADILVEQFRPGVMDRFGLGYGTLRGLNDHLIYCSITGYGQTGPRSSEAGHDINYLGNTGLLAQSRGGAERPVLPPAQIADIGGGSFPAVINILLALLQRGRTGQGSRLDIAMCDAMFTFGIFAHALAVCHDPAQEEGSSLLTGGSPRYNICMARCGTPICVGALEEHFWQRLCDVLEIAPEDRDDISDPQGVHNRIDKAFGRRSAAEWTPLLQQADCCATVLLSFEQAMDDPHFRARGLFGHALDDVAGLVPALPVPIAPEYRSPSDDRDPA